MYKKFFTKTLTLPLFTKKVWQNFFNLDAIMVHMPTYLNHSSKEEIETFLDSFDTIVTDCDGVLWLEDEIIKGSKDTINRFIELEKKVIYVTNNTTKTREEYVDKCKNLGFIATKDKIMSGSYLAANYFNDISFDKKVYVIGSEGLVRELDKYNIKHLDIGPDVVETDLDTYVNDKLAIDPEVEAVLVAFDSHFSYPKLIKAATYLKNPMCHFVAACSDETFPTNTPFIFPGTGCFLRCLEAVSNRKAYVLGKPNDYLKNTILKMHEFNPSRTIVIGDRCNTDILFGKRCGFQTLLVLSGVTSVTNVETYAKSSSSTDNDLVPDYMINTLGDLLPYMSKE